MVCRYVNIPSIIDHEKNKHFPDSDFRPQTLEDWPCNLLIVIVNARRIGKLNSFKLKVHIGWDHRNPQNENFLTFEFSWVSSSESHWSVFLSPNAFHCIVSVGSDFEACWLPSQPSGVKCAVVSQKHPRGLKIQLVEYWNSWWLHLRLHSQ